MYTQLICARTKCFIYSHCWGNDLLFLLSTKCLFYCCFEATFNDFTKMHTHVRKIMRNFYDHSFDKFLTKIKRRDSTSYNDSPLTSLSLANFLFQYFFWGNWVNFIIFFYNLVRVQLQLQTAVLCMYIKRVITQ